MLHPSENCRIVTATLVGTSANTIFVSRKNAIKILLNCLFKGVQKVVPKCEQNCLTLINQNCSKMSY